MHCPFCTATRTCVRKTIRRKRGVTRRRQCARCLTRFTTYEQLMLENGPEPVDNPVDKSARD